MEIFILVLPIPWLAKLQLDRKRKVDLVSLFSLDSLVCLTAIIRLPSIRCTDYADGSYSGVDASLWLVVECNVGIPYACFPIM